MKNFFLTFMAFVICVVFSSSSQSAGGSGGIGIILGDPTGLTYQHKMANDRFMDFYLAYTWDDEWFVAGDYKFALRNVFPSNIPVTPYIGGGLFLHVEEEDKKHKDDIAIGLRIPAGIEWKVPQAPFTVFAELVPGMKFVPSTDAEFQGGIGGRYNF